MTREANVPAFNESVTGALPWKMTSKRTHTSIHWARRLLLFNRHRKLLQTSQSLVLPRALIERIAVQKRQIQYASEVPAHRLLPLDSLEEAPKIPDAKPLMHSPLDDLEK